MIRGATVLHVDRLEEGTDLRMLFKRVQELKSQEEDANTNIYITGYPMLYAWIMHYYPMILMVIGITAAAMADGKQADAVAFGIKTAEYIGTSLSTTSS